MEARRGLKGPSGVVLVTPLPAHLCSLFSSMLLWGYLVKEVRGEMVLRVLGLHSHQELCGNNTVLSGQLSPHYPYTVKIHSVYLTSF